jgi:hypothetical protein
MRRSSSINDIIRIFFLEISHLVSIRIDDFRIVDSEIDQKDVLSVRKKNADSSNIRKSSEMRQKENSAIDSAVVFLVAFVNTFLSTKKRIHHLLNQKKVLIMILI